ncbi:MAG TPA: WYL domain-containing protein, partial [Clostridiales bacterium]|nr:WYL domain-containing protein [Clostridiales bacterium]
MAKSSNQKMKVLYLWKILTEMTDDNHGMTMKEILTELNRYGITAERKSMYDDFLAL